MRLVAAAEKCVPVIRQLTHERFLADTSGKLLRGFEFGFDSVGARLRVFNIHILGVDFPQRRMVFNGFIKPRLGDSGVVHFTVTVAAISDEVNDHVAGEGVAVIQGHAADAQNCIHIFGIHVKDRNTLAAGKLRRKTRRVQLGRDRGESDQVIDDQVDGAADAVAGNLSVIQGLGKDALAGKCSVTVNQ